MTRPNIVMLLTDQQRWDTIASMGYEWMYTPNLDRLMSRGVGFDYGFCNSPVCMPSRQSLFTGQYPSAIGCMDNGVELPESQEIFPQLLKRAGYITANIGKLHFKNHSTRDHRDSHPSYGFDHLILSDEPGCYDDAYIEWVRNHGEAWVDQVRCGSPPECMTEVPIAKPREVHEPHIFEAPDHLTHSAFVAEKSVEFIDQQGQQPFFLCAGFYAPHAPINPPERFLAHYQNGQWPVPTPDAEGQGLKLSDDHWRRIQQYYYALISHVDDQVGRILSALEHKGMLDNTVIVFTSDHGEHLGDHGLIQKGPPGLDSCTRIPFIISWPKQWQASRNSNAFVELVDVAPTILGCAEVPVPSYYQGQSLRPVLEGKSQGRQSAYTEFRTPFGQSWKALRNHHGRLCVNQSGQGFLFDHQSDPKESQNLFNFPQSQRLQAQLKDELFSRWFETEKQLPRKTGAY